uniref:Uncharacterized protein LOC104218455 n=1 Tax=Nicotiana sylvestris TaxID=4096 RepID=A0A1U7VZ21_NICSY
MRYFNRAAYMDMLHRLTGFRSEDPDVAIGSSRMQLVPIRDHLVQIHDTITDDSAEVDVEQYTSKELIGTLPAYCTHDRHIWRASIPLTCLDIVEHHASERVFRQFGFPQPIPTRPAWDNLHYERDDRMRVDDTFIDWLTAQLGIWDSRGDLTPAPQHFPIEVYMAWYRTVSRLFIGNPVHQVDGRYVSYAGRHEALAIGLHTVYRMGQQMQSYIHDPVIMLDYSCRLMDVAAQTLQRGRSDQRLAHQPDYVDPATYQRGRGIHEVVADELLLLHDDMLVPDDVVVGGEE